MPDGDLITDDWQVEIRGLLTGRGTTWRLGPKRIKGLGIANVKTADVDLDGQDGTFGSPDYRGTRVLFVDYVINAATVDAAYDAFATLAAAWVPATANIQLHMRLPGFGHIYFTGRPRGLEDQSEDRRLLGGVLPCVAEFHALDPTIYTVTDPP